MRLLILLIIMSAIASCKNQPKERGQVVYKAVCDKDGTCRFLD